MWGIISTDSWEFLLQLETAVYGLASMGSVAFTLSWEFKLSEQAGDVEKREDKEIEENEPLLERWSVYFISLTFLA